MWSTELNTRRTYAKSDKEIEKDEHDCYKSSCEKCGSEKIRLIYEEYGRDNTGSKGKWEYLCEECGVYFVAILDD